MVKNNPIGVILAWAGDTAPSGFLLCDGSSLLRSDYPDLFSLIGATFGAADGTHFNVPDCRGRMIKGYDSGDSNYNAQGKTGGQKTVNLQHSHTANLHTHTASGSSGNNSTTTAQNGTDNTTIAQNPHTHTISITTGNQSDRGTDNQLSASQAILNPYLVCNWIIRAK